MRIEIEECITQLTYQLSNVSSSMQNIEEKVVKVTDIISNIFIKDLNNISVLKQYFSM
jgi:hypothetical protein